MPSIGPLYSGTVVNFNDGGTTAWTNPTNAQGDTTGTAATVNIGTNGGTSHILRASNFGFSIPSGATIVGVETYIENQAANNNRHYWDSAQLLVNGAIAGDDRAAGLAVTTSKDNKLFGAPDDLWGTSLTPALVNASNFGMNIKLNRNAQQTTTSSIFRVALVVYYEETTTVEDSFVADAVLEAVGGGGGTQITVSPTSGADDASWWTTSTGTGYSSIATQLAVGDWSTTLWDYHSAIRFPGVTIPQGATINSASLKVTSTGSGNPQTTTIYGEAVDNASDYSSDTHASMEARSLTTSSVVWPESSAWTSGVAYDSPDISSVIQEIVNRSGWSSGNALALIWREALGYSGVASRVLFAAHEHTTQPEAVLTINYTAGAGATVSFTANAVLKKIDISASITSDAVLKQTDIAQTYVANAIVLRTEAFTFVADARLIATVQSSFTGNAYLVEPSEELTWGGWSEVFSNPVPFTFTANARLRVIVPATFTADSVLRRVELSDFDADAVIQTTVESGFSADAVLKKVDNAGSVTSDAYLVGVFGPTIRYVSANPGSYAYLDNKRWNGSSFQPLSGTDLTNCPTYNDWKYGLDNRNAYTSQLTVQEQRDQFEHRLFHILAGDEDTDPAADDLDVTCQGSWQGAHRLERAQRFYAHLADHYGQPTHTLDVMAEVGHAGEQTLNHAHARQYMFGGTYPSTYGWDTFNRTESGTWGNADVGGGWSHTTAAAHSVSGGVGIQTHATANTNRFARLFGNDHLNLEVYAQFSTDKVAVGGSIFIYPVVRYLDTSNHYRCAVALQTSGAISVRWQSVVGGTATDLGSAVTTGYTHSANAWYHVRAQSEGVSPTTLRVKVWPDGQSEPSSWQIEITNSAAALQVAGAPGVRTILSSSATNMPVDVRWRRFHAGSLNAAPVVTATATRAAPAVKSFSLSPSGSLPYWSDGDLDEGSIASRAIIVLHGGSRNGDGYFTYARNSAALAGSDALVVAPQEVRSGDTGYAGDSLVFDSLEWVRGGPSTNSPNLSSYAALDQILTRLSDTGAFPNLTEIVVIGHSGGAQFAQRHALTSVYNSGESARSMVADAVLKRADNLGSFTANAVLQRIESGTFTSDARLLVPVTVGFTANAVIQRTESTAVSANAVLRTAVEASFTANAVFRRESTGSFTANAALRGVVTNTFTADARLLSLVSDVFTASSVLKSSVEVQFTASAWLLSVVPQALTADAILRRTETGSIAADAVLRVTNEASLTAFAVLIATLANSFTANALLLDTEEANLTSDAWILRIEPATFSANAYLILLQTGSLTSDAILRGSAESSVVADARLLRVEASQPTADSVLRGTIESAFTADAWILNIASAAFNADAYIINVLTQTFTGNAVLRTEESDSITSDARLLRTESDDITAESIISRTEENSFIASASLLAVEEEPISADAYLIIYVEDDFTADALLLSTVETGFTANAFILVEGANNISADAVLKSTRDQNFSASAVISGIESGSFGADSWIKGITEGSFTASAILRSAVDGSLQANAVLRASVEWQAYAAAVLLGSTAQTYTANAVLLAVSDGSFTANAYFLTEGAFSFITDAVLRGTLDRQFTADSRLRTSVEWHFYASAILRTSATGSFDANSVILRPETRSWLSSAILRRSTERTWTAAAVIKGSVEATFTADAFLQLVTGDTFTANAVLRGTYGASAAADAVLKDTKDRSFEASALIVVGFVGSFTADAEFDLPIYINQYQFIADAVLRDIIDRTFVADARLHKAEIFKPPVVKPGGGTVNVRAGGPLTKVGVGTRPKIRPAGKKIRIR
jgi:pimeloyl-ACP methyl ester carboxylesterase